MKMKLDCPLSPVPGAIDGDAILRRAQLRAEEERRVEERMRRSLDEIAVGGDFECFRNVFKSLYGVNPSYAHMAATAQRLGASWAQPDALENNPFL